MVGGGAGSAFLTPIVWLFAALLFSVPALAIVRAVIVDGTLDWAMGAGLFLGLLMGAGLILTGGGAGFTVMGGLLLLGVCGGWPLIAKQSDKKLSKKLRNDDIVKLERAVQFDSSNAGAHAGLAEKWAEMAQLEAAVDEYRIAIRLMPDGPTTKRWKTELRTVLDRQEGIDRYDFAVCRNCDKEISSKANRCPHCGEIRNINFLVWAAQPENLWPALRLGAIGTIVIIVLWSALHALPGAVIGLLIMLALIGAAWYFLQSMQT